VDATPETAGVISMGERNTGRRELGFVVEEVAGAEVHGVGEG